MEREVNFQQNPYNTSHHTFSMLPRYLAKVRSSSFGISGRNANKNVTYAVIFEHTPNFNTLSLVTYLLLQFPVPVKYSL